MEPEPGGKEGLADVRIIPALVESQQKDRPVRISPLGEVTRPSEQEIHICRGCFDEVRLTDRWLTSNWQGRQKSTRALYDGVSQACIGTFRPKAPKD